MKKSSLSTDTNLKQKIEKAVDSVDAKSTVQGKLKDIGCEAIDTKVIVDRDMKIPSIATDKTSKLKKKKTSDVIEDGDMKTSILPTIDSEALDPKVIVDDHEKTSSLRTDKTSKSKKKSVKSKGKGKVNDNDAICDFVDAVGNAQKVIVDGDLQMSTLPAGTTLNSKTKKMSDALGNLPPYVAIPNQTINHLFRNHPNVGHTVFAIHPVEGDGNCLYRSLSLSTHYSKSMPDLSTRHRFLREMLQSYAAQQKNHAFLSRIWNALVKSKKEDSYDHWVRRIGQSTIWGSTAEIMLFAACLQIHVVCVELLRDTVGCVATQPTFTQCKVRGISTSDPIFYTLPPKSAKNVIFLWNHCHDDPYKVHLPLETPADHYTLLELLQPQPKTFPESTFIFQHVHKVDSDFADLEDTTEDESIVGKGNLGEDRKNSNKRKIIADNSNSRKRITKEIGKKKSTVASEVKELEKEDTEYTKPRDDCALTKSFEIKESLYLDNQIQRKKKSTLDSAVKNQTMKKL
jgi:hypothetical protein